MAIYMNRKANDKGFIPNEFDTLQLIEALKFKRSNSMPTHHIEYARRRMAEG